ncbi:MAG: alpha/beta fold hydrolase, partial [Eubacteriales bacterium]
MAFTVKEKEVLSSDGVHMLKGRVYIPEGEIKGLFQLAHGMTEHIGRYEAFFAFMAERGYVVFAYDHLGHGKTGDAMGELGFIAEKNGDKILPEDVHVFGNAVRADFTGKKTILLGHSMGSFVVRNYAEKYGNEISGLIIMGTGGPNPAAKPGIALASVIKAFCGAHHISPFVDKLAFGKYNDRTEKKTGSDWLSVNEENVSKFLADDHCTFKFTVSAM